MTKFIVAFFLFTMMGVAYIKGYDIVKAKSPRHLPHFYLAMATIRVLTVLAMIGIYMRLSCSREQTINFAIVCLVLYAVMMVITLTLRH